MYLAPNEIDCGAVGRDEMVDRTGPVAVPRRLTATAAMEVSHVRQKSAIAE